MTIPNIDSITSVSSSPSPSHHFLKVGVLRIEGREYTVSVESSDPLIKSPHADTLDKIRDLVNFHLNHLNMKGVDLSTIMIQELDERGLSYVKDTGKDMEQNLLPYSEVDFKPYNASNPFMESTYPPSLRNPFIGSLGDAYRSIIDSLTKKPESEKDETRPILANKENPFKEQTNLEPRIEQIKLKQVTESSNESLHSEEEISESESEDENVGLISGRSKDLSEYNQSSIINSIKFQASSLFSKMRDFLPTLRHKADPINAEEVIAQEESTFRSGLSSEEQASLARFSSIHFD